MFTQKVILNLMSISGRKSFRVRCPFQKRNSFGISYIDVRFKRRSHLVLPRCTFHKRSLLYYPDDLFIKEVFWYQLDVHLKTIISYADGLRVKTLFFLRLSKFGKRHFIYFYFFPFLFEGLNETMEKRGHKIMSNLITSKESRS